MTTRKSKQYMRTCIVCGCTDNCGCTGGCSWVGPVVCSRCSDIRALVLAVMRAAQPKTLSIPEDSIVEVWTNRSVRRAIKSLLRNGLESDDLSISISAARPRPTTRTEAG